jgi:hypothetical protein
MRKTIGILLVSAVAVFAVPADDAAVPMKESRVQQRRENQQRRIAQGVQSGQLTAKETAHLENKEHRLNKEIHNDRVANGGKLTPQEKAEINRQQNRLSKDIYKEKHDAQQQPR